MSKRRIIDQRNKEKFQVDDEYLNGMARHCGITATGVYLVLCRHANYKTQTAFPSKKLMAEKLGISERSVYNGIMKLDKRNVIQIINQGRKNNGSFNVKNYILIDKSEWKYPSANRAVGKKRHSPSANNDTHRRQNLPKKDTHVKETNKKEVSDDDLEFYQLKERYPNFGKFYELYPRKVRGRDALKAFKKLNPSQSLLKTILKDIEAKKQTEEWIKEDGKYIPHPSTYLNQRRWEDEDKQSSGWRYM